MWTNPSQKSRQGSDPPPIQAMPEFWEHLDLAPLPNTDLVEENTQTRQVKVPAHVRNIEREQHQAEAAAL